MAQSKPDWLRVRIPGGEGSSRVMDVLQRYRLNTVCQSASCPNQGECFGNRTATFMIMGNTCTRNCGYCGVQHGRPVALDPEEPTRVAHAVADLALAYVVVTSVTRDDVGIEGARVFAETIRQIRERNPETGIEVLIPDFGGDSRSIDEVVGAAPDVIGHNLEVTQRLFPVVRPQGDYDVSLAVLKQVRLSCTSKSGFMIGLGESREEILATMTDLSEVADLLTIGQYLQPTTGHLPVDRYYSPEEFDAIAEQGRQMGFRHVEAGPLVRSSYHAGDYGL